ncbi:MAG TPA: DUF177 domain-containing protein [Alphaproteobacteria bacterium]|nr:DUF177 domain-containing protein [Alphaproteobacteria bacterium]
MSGGNRLRLRDATLRVDSTPPEGRELVLDVPADELAELAGRVGVSAVDSLSVRLRAVRFRGGFRVTGRLDAEVTQPSIISLEPVSQHVSEPIDRVFLPGGEKPYAGAANAEVFVDVEGEDLPDHFEGGEADLTELIVETLALGIDPYPRREGERIEDLGIDSGEAADRPFAGLADLKRQGGGR